MVLEAIVLGLIIGFFRNGRWYNLIEIEFKGWYFIFLGALLQIVPIAATKWTEQFEILQWTPVIGMGLIFIAVLMNAKLKGFKVIAAGAFLNLVAMLLHGGKMPISIDMTQLAGLSSYAESIKSGTIINLISFDEAHTLFKWMGKIIPIPKPYPLAKVISLGDVLITFGIVYFIQGEMVYYHFRSRGKMLKFSIKSRL
jgi:hypothetical protein